MSKRLEADPLAAILSALRCAELAVPTWARGAGRRRERAEGPPTRAEFTKLQSDVREQRQLIIQMMQTEQQRYDMLLRLLQGQGGGTPVPGLAAPPARERASPPRPTRRRPSRLPRPRRRPPRRRPSTARIASRAR